VASRTRFNATFNNISVMSWWSVLLVEETGIPEKTNDMPQITYGLYGGQPDQVVIVW
jgi:hypothetical protein